MKTKLLKLIQKTILAVAIFSAATPSQMGLYQPKCPKQLKKFHI